MASGTTTNGNLKCPSWQETIVPNLFVTIVATGISVTFVKFFIRVIIISNEQQSSNQSSKLNKKSRDTKQIKYLALTSLTLYLIGIIMFVISGLLQLIVKFECETIDLMSLSPGVNLIGFTTLLSLFSVRLIKTFDNTSYALTNKLTKSIKGVLIGLFSYLFLMCIGSGIGLPVRLIVIATIIWLVAIIGTCVSDFFYQVFNFCRQFYIFMFLFKSLLLNLKVS